jgi:hypothetical protein
MELTTIPEGIGELDFSKNPGFEFPDGVDNDTGGDWGT